MYDTIAILVGGFFLGVISSWILIRYGFNLGARQLYEQKEGLPPKSIDMPVMEQSQTEDEEEEY